MSKAKRDHDWEKIEADYRTGKYSLRELSEIHGPAHPVIAKRAKKYGWTKDLTEQVSGLRAAALRGAIEAVVRREVMSAAEAVDMAVRRAIEEGDTPTALYRHWAIDKTLLYVGVSETVMQRTAQHMAGARWAQEIAAITLEWFPTRWEALAAEGAAISREAPKWNIAGRM